MMPEFPEYIDPQDPFLPSVPPSAEGRLLAVSAVVLASILALYSTGRMAPKAEETQMVHEPEVFDGRK